MGTKPTPKQIAFLQKAGVQPPSSKSAASHLIDFMLKGTGAGNYRTLEQRFAAIRAFNEKWVGKSVQEKTGEKRIGKVKWLVARTPGEIVYTILDMREDKVNIDAKHLLPFRAAVDWGNKHSICALSYLEIVDETQKIDQ